ncbi:MAG: methylthioribulose 1-phosphate dehydratase [Bacteroidetes bacterium]|nr:methylthioribulose 1-phosphate dehydratase [Bacteroidota bacterium]
MSLHDQIAQVIRNYHSKGWSPATSTNYSFKDEKNQIWVSRSGIDKSEFKSEDFIKINSKGEAIEEYVNLKPSAETLIHCLIYEMFPETKVILHSHGINPVLISTIEKTEVTFEGFEIQKGFEGQRTHLSQIRIPIMDNSQEMPFFEKELIYRQSQLTNHCFIIRKHGTYAWGKSLFEAKRHLETLDYLCECKFKMIK